MIAWLTDTLLMTGAIMALILVVRRPVGRWFGPGAAYALWALPMIRLLLPPLTLPEALAVGRVSDVLAPAAAPSLPMGEQMPSMVDAAVAPASLPDAAFVLPWTTMLLAIWLGGAVVFLLHRLISYRHMREELMRDARVIGHSGLVRIVETPAVDAPVAFGVTDRVVALPYRFLATADSDASDFAISHELEHHAGNDLLANMAVQPLFALHWFNPLAWLAWRAFRSDQEAACDARVMAGCSRRERERYGRLIASFAAGSRFALAAPMAGPLRGDKPIIHRLKALVRNDVPERHRMLGRSLFAASIIAVPLTASVTYAADEGDEVATQASAVAPALPTTAPTPKFAEAAEQPRAQVHLAAQSEGSAWVSRAEERATARQVDVEGAQAHAEVMQANAEAQVEAAAARAEARAAEHEAEIVAAVATRRAHAAMAMAPRVEQSFSSDGKIQTMKIVTRGRDGMPVHTSTTVIDSSCPADQQRVTRAVSNGRVAETRICTGAPHASEHAAAAMRHARATVARTAHMSAELRSELTADLDEAEADIAHDLR
jgi:beta-lactamase regulating signal transducer with metallopeptidase domain